MKRTMRPTRFVYYPETKVKLARRLTERHPWMGELKSWLAQEAILRWWNYPPKRSK